MKDMKTKLIIFTVLYLLIAAGCVAMIVNQLTANVCNWWCVVLFAAMFAFAALRAAQFVKSLKCLKDNG